ncbi:RadC family protein [Sphingomonas sp.]|uniref:JAB domain-containing protein n=1 Tax=Sphingomonas sp. TaxID=28214 RepID=UPI001B1FEB42|nr:DNA repair protein RadC [Sphingomonas sp.]MBO9711913.1 DNA repair protein RadC [Sphingomonas sp.]
MSAERLVGEFGSLGRVLAASPEARTRACGSRAAADQLSVVGEAILCVVREEAEDAMLLGSSSAVIAYLRARHAHSGIEIGTVLFLNARNRLLKDEMISAGTVEETSFWPREIIKRALELDASGVILAHNHPSGDAQPSKQDIEVTRTMSRQCRIFDIVLHDHLVLSPSGHSSMRALGLL